MNGWRRSRARSTEAAVLLAERVDERRAREVVRERERSIVHDGGGGERRVPPARDGDRTELGGRGAELVHVPARDGREVHGLGKPAERDLDVLLDEILGVHLTGATHHLRALRGPGDREDVQHVARLPCTDRERRVVRRRPGPHHPATPLRHPEVVRGPEVRVERCRVELASHEGRIHEAVDRRGGKPGVRQRALHGLGGDLLRTASRSAGVRRLPHADDGDLARDVLEGRRATPVAVRHGPHP